MSIEQSQEKISEARVQVRKEQTYIMLAEKYGWEAVDCHVQEPLVCH